MLDAETPSDHNETQQLNNNDDVQSEIQPLQSQEELVAERAWADYVYGPVSGKPDFIQIAFKISRAFAVLNASPRTIYKVYLSHKLEFVKRIDPR